MKTNNEVLQETKKQEWKVTENHYAVQIAQWGQGWISVLCEIPTLPYGDKEKDLATAFKICEAVNNYDKLKEDNEVLLNALKSVQNIVSFLINTTPTGDNRNRLTHVNILSLEAIRQVESKIKYPTLKNTIMEKNEIELAGFKEQANTYYKNLTKNAPHKGIGSHEYIYFSYGIEWAFNHLPQSNYNKLKEDNALLLDALKGLYEFNLGKPDYLDTLLNNAESAIRKAESK